MRGDAAVKHNDAATSVRPGVAPLLVFAIGNPSRGDDALGPTLGRALRTVEESAAAAHARAELLEVVQLQIEDALELEGRSAVLFIDAERAPRAEAGDAAAAGRRADGVCLRRLRPARAAAFTHALAPGALLEVAQRVLDRPLPPAWVLAIRGSAFELGAPLSAAARARLPAALALARAWLAAQAGAPRARNTPGATPAVTTPARPGPRA